MARRRQNNKLTGTETIIAAVLFGVLLGAFAIGVLAPVGHWALFDLMPSPKALWNDSYDPAKYGLLGLRMALTFVTVVALLLWLGALASEPRRRAWPYGLVLAVFVGVAVAV